VTEAAPNGITVSPSTTTSRSSVALSSDRYGRAIDHAGAISGSLATRPISTSAGRSTSLNEAPEQLLRREHVDECEAAVVGIAEMHHQPVGRTAEILEPSLDGSSSRS
jgi:hypothetical protein